MTDRRAFAAGVVTGAAATAGLAWLLWRRLREDDGHSRADWSMFYGYVPKTGGSTPPIDCSADDERWLRETRPEYKRIPKEVYGAMVQNAIITCVDVVLVRPDGCTLLVRRGMEPVKGFWWWPGGRMFKGALGLG
uniref:Nudix hydrolase domain-containing protein n=1 Tax=Phaeomonas parva TaxID=124430 RepID=A0A6U4IB85_9STRA|mmetsp:Transcript_39197/g.122625  ORF Transcript_39197/g.122625 Transcript_39197/m.122625 type:complete len:135 (+) Transcript_39197:141-545(+)